MAEGAIHPLMAGIQKVLSREKRGSRMYQKEPSVEIKHRTVHIQAAHIQNLCTILEYCPVSLYQILPPKYTVRTTDLLSGKLSQYVVFIFSNPCLH